MLQAAAAELDAMEEEHYDDREQGQREIERLERLIAETRDAVEALKEQISSGKRTYALIPYEGPNGTFRRPIYIECRKDELILQPEGVRITQNDLYPLFGAGNPLASALRAARDYYVQLHPQEGRGRDSEPYPLLVVRPEGRSIFYLAQGAIRSSDFEFGFELVEEDWELKYPVADPKLASLEQQAVDQARIRQQALAAAAPRAYRQATLVLSGRFDIDDDGSEADGFSAAGGNDEGGLVGSPPGTGGTAQAASNDGRQQPGADGTSGGGGPLHTGKTAAGTPGSEESDAMEGKAADGTAAQPGGGSTVAAGRAAAMAASAGTSAGATGGSAGSEPMDPSTGNQVVVSTGAPSPDQTEEAQTSPTATPSGRDWALNRKKPQAVPIRRSLKVVVRHDFIAILPDEAQVDPATSTGQRISIQGDTAESLDQFVAAVREHIDGWGIAGEGLYWRPVLILNVGPDGRRRADDLTRLLKDSGLELRTATATNSNPEDETGATRAR